jgi:thymidylate kinase
MLIVIEGPDGSGKTTLLNNLKEYYPNAIFTTPFENDYGRLVLNILNYSHIEFPKIDDFSDNKDDLSSLYYHKIELMKNAIYNSYHLLKDMIASKHMLVIMDRWVPSFYTYQKPFLTESTNNFFNTLFSYRSKNAMCYPDYTFYLMPPKDFLIKNIQSRKNMDNLDRYFLESLDSTLDGYNKFINLHENECFYKVYNNPDSYNLDKGSIDSPLYAIANLLYKVK